MGFFSRVIRSDIPGAFFSQVPERIDGAFASSHRRATMDGRVLPEQMAYARGTDRHYAVQRGVVDAAVSLGAEQMTARIGTSRYPMSLVRMGGTIIATSITDSLDNLRRSQARLELAKLNAALDPVQLSLLETEEDEPPLDGYRFAMILVAKPHRDADQSLPGGIFFGVPTVSLRSWHFYQSMDSVRGLYEEADWAETPVADRRIPRLRAIRRSTGSDEDTGTEG